MSRPALWALLALPGGWIAWRWITVSQAYGAGHAIGDTGMWAAWLLLVTLAVTPVRLLARKSGAVHWLARRRRDLGLASFAYGAAHTAIYCLDRGAIAAIVEQAKGLDMMTGWLALALFVPLAATSNDVSVRRLKQGWKRLHRLVHPAAVLVFAHWALAAFDPALAYGHIAILALIEGARIALQRRQSVT
mgnify:CR=1 FL=1